MWSEASGQDELISLADLAEMAQVKRPAVSNWRRRHPDFPVPVSETGAAALFRLRDVEDWMGRHGKEYEPPSVTQQLWSALTLVRGGLLPEEVLVTALVLVGLTASRVSRGVSTDAIITNGSADILLEWMLGTGREATEGESPASSDPKFDVTTVERGIGFLRVVVRLAVRHGCGTVAEGLLEALGRELRRSAGDHRTPPSVVRLLVALAEPFGGVVWDPACGHGEVLSAVSGQAGGRVGLRLVGREIDEFAARIGSFRLLAHGVPSHVAVANSLAPDAAGAECADTVLVDPPLTRPSGVEWLRLALRLTRADGRAFVVTPIGLLSSRIAERSRRDLISSGRVRAVIALPPGLHAPHSTTAVALWCLRQSVVDDKSVLLVDASAMGSRTTPRTELTGGDIAAIASCLRQRQGVADSSRDLRSRLVAVEDLVVGDVDLDPARWLEPEAVDAGADELRFADTAKRWAEAHERYRSARVQAPAVTAVAKTASQWRTVREMVDERTIAVVRSRRIDSRFRGAGGVPLIQLGDLTDAGRVMPSGSVDPELLDHDPDFTVRGDVLVQLKGSKLRTAVDWTGGAVVAAPVHVVRCLSDRIDPLVLAAMLAQSTWHYTTGSTAMWHVDLYRVRVPLLDRSTNDRLAGALREIGDLRDLADAAARAADDLTAGLVDGVGTGVFRLLGEEGS